MKIKIILAALLGAVSINGAVAGSSYCEPPATGGKYCAPDDCCPDVGGSISVGYATDYLFRGVRLAEDVLWGDINYTFEGFCVPVTLGYRHVTSLSSRWGNALGASGANNGNWGGPGGDHGNAYVGVGLPSLLVLTPH